MPEFVQFSLGFIDNSGIARVLGLFLRLKLGLNFSIYGRSLKVLTSNAQKAL